jgi:hypothetical protein
MRYGRAGGIMEQRYHAAEVSWSRGIVGAACRAPREHVDPLGVSNGFGIRFELEARCFTGVGMAIAKNCRA